MEDFYSDQSHQQNKPKEDSPPFEAIGLKRETPEEIIAQNVSQQLLTSAFESQKKDNESQELEFNLGSDEHTFIEQLVEEPIEPIHQNIEIQSEQRFSGIPIQQYIYDEEEEDEEESDDEIVIQPIETQRKDEELLAFRASPDLKQENNNLFDLSVEPQNQSKEEILYHLSDDNVLTAQSYGIGSDLRIDSTSSEPNQEVSVYELNSEDPFSTPEKHKTEVNKNTEREFERFVEKCEPFETIATDLEEPKLKKSIDLLDLNQSLIEPQESREVPIEFEPMFESESEAEPNHSLSHTIHTIATDKSADVLPSSVGHTESTESHIHSIPESTNKSDTDFNPTLSPNLDSFEPTLTSSTHHFEEAFPTTQPITSSPQQIETIEESPITSSVTETQSTEAVEPQEEIISEKMTKREQREAEHAVTTPTKESNCPCASGAWLNPNQMNPTVAELVYWRDPKKSGAVFGAGLAILLSLTVFSIISVIAYASLAALSVTLSFRIYKNILQAVQKTSEGHPFKEYLEIEITPSSERIHEIVDSVLSHTNCTLNKLRSVFLVEDIIDSLKFVVLFWCLTYIGSWFNGLTLIILAYLGLFSVPKVYEMNKTQVDQYLNLASTQINDITSKIRAKIPFPAKKEKDN